MGKRIQRTGSKDRALTRLGDLIDAQPVAVHVEVVVVKAPPDRSFPLLVNYQGLLDSCLPSEFLLRKDVLDVQAHVLLAGAATTATHQMGIAPAERCR
jgi:hypothetical protein